MKPPLKRPGSSGCKGRRKKPKRLSYKLTSPLVPNDHNNSITSPATLIHCSPPHPHPTPPSFNLSFDSDLHKDFISCVEKVECNYVYSSTPMTPHQSLHRASGSAMTAVPPVSYTYTPQIGSACMSASPLFSSTSFISREDAPGLTSLTNLTSFPAGDALRETHSLSSFMSTPAKKSADHLKLSEWGLPDLVLQKYALRGIVSMYEWQADCLSQPGVLQGGNLVFSAPTSGGKTFIAELLALKCVLETRKKVLIILPFVSIAHEKARYLQSIFESVGVRVGGFMGGQSPSGGFSSVDIAVCTIEKANGLVNRLLEEASLSQLGAVVVDELHMIADSHRGYLLELLLTKLLYFSHKGKKKISKENLESLQDIPNDEKAPSPQPTSTDVHLVEGATQIIGMSATLPNLDTLATWLGGHVYCTDFRPVPLKEMVKIGPSIFDAKLKKLRDLPSFGAGCSDEEDVLHLCQETIDNGHSVLIFCPTKQWCENLAGSLASAAFLATHNQKSFSQGEEGGGGRQGGVGGRGGGGVGGGQGGMCGGEVGGGGRRWVKERGEKKEEEEEGGESRMDGEKKSTAILDREALDSVLEQLQRTQVGLDNILKKTVPCGVAFHHAGLTFEEREIVEAAFRQGHLKVLVATSTLSSGVNLPARLVIVRTPFFQRTMLDVLTYKQMVGRAGRKGEDEAGESILICKPSEKSKIVELLQSAPKPVQSCLNLRKTQSGGKTSSGKLALRRALLEVIVSGTATTEQDLEMYITCTLFFADEMEQKSPESSKAVALESMHDKTTHTKTTFKTTPSKTTPPKRTSVETTPSRTTPPKHTSVESTPSKTTPPKHTSGRNCFEKISKSSTPSKKHLTLARNLVEPILEYLLANEFIAMRVQVRAPTSLESVGKKAEGGKRGRGEERGEEGVGGGEEEGGGGEEGGEVGMRKVGRRKARGGEGRERKGGEDGEEEVEGGEGEYYATQLGAATVASALSPEEALIVFSELRRARRSFVLENELHIIYLVTPVYVQEQWPKIDWYRFLCLLERLFPDGRLVATTIGIKEAFLASAIQGKVPERTAAQQERLRIHRRFFTALALNDLVHEVPIPVVAQRYGASKGLLQTLQSAAGVFAGMVTVFCRRLGWANLELLLSQFQSRLTFGVERELCELVRVPLLNGFRARSLYNAGFHSLSALASANPLAIELCLRNAVPFRSSKAAHDLDGSNHLTATTNTTWCAKLRKGMTEWEAAKLITEEAQRILSEDLNIPLGTWKMMNFPSAQFDLKLLPRGQIGQMRDTQDFAKPDASRKRKSGGKPSVGFVNDVIDIKKPCLQLTRNSRAVKIDGKENRKSVSVEKNPKTERNSQNAQSPKPLPVPKLNSPEVHIAKQTDPFSNVFAVQKTPSIDVLPPSTQLPPFITSTITASTLPTNTVLSSTVTTSTLPVALNLPAPEEIGDSISYSPILSSNLPSPSFCRSPSSSLLHTPLLLESPEPPTPPQNLPVYDEILRKKTKSPIPHLSVSDKPVSISNSFPVSMDMSINLSYDTLAMIDAACGKECVEMIEEEEEEEVELEDEKEEEEEEENEEEEGLRRERVEDSFGDNMSRSLLSGGHSEEEDDKAEENRAIECSTKEQQIPSSPSLIGPRSENKRKLKILIKPKFQTPPTQPSTSAKTNTKTIQKTDITESNIDSKKQHLATEIATPVKRTKNPIPTNPQPQSTTTSVVISTLSQNSVVQSPTSVVAPTTSPRRSPQALSPSPSLSFQPSLKDLSSIPGSQVSLSQSGACIIEVSVNALLFRTFLSECLEQKFISFSVATVKASLGGGCIGSRIMAPKTERGVAVSGSGEQIVGVAFSWGEMDAYYLSLCRGSASETEEDAVSIEARLEAVQEILQNKHCHQLIAYSIKKHIKTLALALNIFPTTPCLDPTVADWMLSPDGKEKTIHKMVLHYLPDQPSLSEGDDYEDMSLSSLATHASEPRVQASAESLLAALLMGKLRTLLESEELYKSFLKVEMPCVKILTKMELNGIGFSKEKSDSLNQILQQKLTALELEAYSLAGRSFSLTSPEDTARVLFLELKLPSSSSSTVATASRDNGKPQKSLGPNRRGRRRLQHLSTSKEILEKLQSHHRLPGVILQWRRVSMTVTKTVFPLFKSAVWDNTLCGFRIHSLTHFHTSTGRVATSDPNIQMVPKEYALEEESTDTLTAHAASLKNCALRKNPTSCSSSSSSKGDLVGELLSESQVLRNACRANLTGEIKSTTSYTHTSYATNTTHRPSTHTSSDRTTVCMRDTFIPYPGAIFLAADYSQLELRILAHMSGDRKLQKLLNSDGDVFKMIAGEWLGVPSEAVSAQERQNAKQICYGMIYGIGCKALAQQLGVLEEDAAQFMDTFKSKYPTMKKYLSRTVEACKERGYIVTVLGRRRYLPGIHSRNMHARSQAERQAVNSTIQGSAADLVKTAMIKIDSVLRNHFPGTQSCLALTHKTTTDTVASDTCVCVHNNVHCHRERIEDSDRQNASCTINTTCNPHQHKCTHTLPTKHTSSVIENTHTNPHHSKCTHTPVSTPRGAYLVLQLHDELLYEVCIEDLPTVSHIVQKHMETALPLSVHFPVKIKTGTSWGTLVDYVPSK